MRWVLVGVVAVMGCQSSSAEKWEGVMQQTGFGIGSLHFEENGPLRAIGQSSGRVFERDATWNKWTQQPGFVASTPPATVQRLWDVKGNVYVSNGAIYRSPRNAPKWERLATGKELITVDPDGTVFARSGNVFEVKTSSADWQTILGVDAIDPQGRAWFGTQRYAGAELVADDLMKVPNVFDVRGRVLHLENTNDAATIERHAVGDAQVQALHHFSTAAGRKLELLGCGVNDVCLLLADDEAVFQVKPGDARPRQVGSLIGTSQGDSLNFSGYRLWVSPEGVLYVSEAMGDQLGTISISRVTRLIPGTGEFPGEELL